MPSACCSRYTMAAVPARYDPRMHPSTIPTEYRHAHVIATTSSHQVTNRHLYRRLNGCLWPRSAEWDTVERGDRQVLPVDESTLAKPHAAARNAAQLSKRTRHRRWRRFDAGSQRSDPRSTDAFSVDSATRAHAARARRREENDGYARRQEPSSVFFAAHQVRPFSQAAPTPPPLPSRTRVPLSSSRCGRGQTRRVPGPL